MCPISEELGYERCLKSQLVLDETATVSKIHTDLTGIAMGNISFLPILIRRTHGYWYRKKSDIQCIFLLLSNRFVSISV
jgi:hypothetical protein